MSQSKGPDQGHGSAVPPRSRLEAFDPREQRGQAPVQQPGYAPQPYAPQGYAPQPYVPQSQAPQAGSPPPYGGGSTAGGYSYPQAQAPLPPQPAPRQQAQPPQLNQSQGQPAPHSAYQYLPQGYSHPAHGEQSPPSRQDPRFDARYDPAPSGAADPRVPARTEPRFDPQADPRGQPRHVQPLSQLPGYARPPQPPHQPVRQPAPAQPPAPPAFDPSYLQQALAQPTARTAPPAPSTAPPAPALRGGHFDHHASDDPRGYGLPSQIPARPVPQRGDYGAAPAPRAQSWESQDDLPPHPDALIEDEEELEEPPRRGGRRILMVGLLLGAIATGGGLAYAYKTYFGPARGSVPKVVKAPGDPTRVAPSDPGGKKVANGDIKVLDRLPSDGQRVDGEGREIRVRTIPLTQNGQIAAPPAQAIEPRAPTAVAPTAGILLRDSGVPGLPASQPPPAPSIQAAPPSQTRSLTITNTGAGQTAAAPLTPAAPPVQVQAAPARKVAVAPPAEPPAPPKAPVAKKAKEPDAFSPNGTVGAPQPAAKTIAAPPAANPGAPAAKSAGFVAALSSHDTKDAALRSMADLQQSYGTALAGKLLDVAPTDAATKARGFNYRVVVGPPGSRTGANAVCGQLKTAGYTTCWAVPFQTE